MDNFCVTLKILEVVQSIEPHGCRRKLAMAIIRYGSLGKEPELTGKLKEVFEEIRPEIDANRNKYEQ